MLEIGVFSKKCSSQNMCHNICDQRHHISICIKDENKNENSLVTHVGVSREILLETAELEIFNIESDEKLTTPLMLNRPCIVSNAWIVFL